MTTSAPLLSIIAPTRNRPPQLSQALQSIADQNDVDLAEAEAIVLHDGTTPVTETIGEGRTPDQRLRP